MNEERFGFRLFVRVCVRRITQTAQVKLESSLRFPDRARQLLKARAEQCECEVK